MTTKVNSSVLSTTGVTSGNYGSSTQITKITVDAQGRLTSAANVASNMFANTISYNVGVGSTALDTVTSGIQNSAYGHDSLTDLLSGILNTSIGYQSGYAITTANNNTSVGAESLIKIAGDNNTAIGAYSLYNVTGYKNTGIGYASGQNITTGNNNVILGGYVGLATPISATGNNFVVLSDGAGTVRQTHNLSGAVAFDTAGTAYGTSGQVLQSNGNAAVPTWTTNIGGTSAGLSATLVVGSGGTGVATAPTSGGIVYGASVSTQGYSAAGTSGQVLTSGVAGVPLWKTLGGLGISEFASGTAILFQQTAAPTGWTKVTTHNDKSLRIVSGTVGSGGTVAFSTAFSSKTPAGTVSVATSIGTLAVGIGTLAGTIGTLAESAVTLTTAQIPSHNHPNGATSTAGWGYVAGGSFTSVSATGATGGGGSHTHGITGAPGISGSPSLTGAPSITSATFTGTAIDLAVQYVDAIIATKDA